MLSEITNPSDEFWTYENNTYNSSPKTLIVSINLQKKNYDWQASVTFILYYALLSAIFKWDEEE